MTGFPFFRALVAAVLLPSPVVAQNTATVDSGTVVRLSLPADTVRGRLIAPVQQSALLITYCRYPGVPCNDPLAAGIDSAEVSGVVHLNMANGSNWKRGALIGGGIGAALGGFGLIVARGLCESPDCEGDALRGAIGITVVGAALGAAFGATSLTWERIW